MIAAIVCADKNWGIGYQGDLLAKIPEDMAFFKKQTEGETVIMGRKTYDSLPVKPLPNRENIIISRTHIPKHNECGVRIHEKGDYFPYRLEQVQTILDFVQRCDNTVKINNMFIIGGGQIYKELLPYCQKVYVTEIDNAFKNVDTYFPNLDEMPNWWLIESSKPKEYEGLTYRFNVYEQVNYEILDVVSDYTNNKEVIRIRFYGDDVVHNIVIKYFFHGSETVKLQTFTVPALCCKKNFDKFMVKVQFYKQNKEKLQKEFMDKHGLK